MSPRKDSSALKRAQPHSSPDVANSTAKKPRRSQRIQQKAPTSAPMKPDPAPTSTASPQPQPPRTPVKTPAKGEMTPVSSPGPLEATQPASQFYYPPPLDGDIGDEEDENVWGYLTALGADPEAEQVVTRLDKTSHCSREKKSPRRSCSGTGASPSGFLIGRHAECDLQVESAVISNRHCVIYKEVADGKPKAVLEDLSSNGTWVNGVVVGRNHRRDLRSGDEIELAGGIQYMFRYPMRMRASPFRDAYDLGGVLGSGHFATVHVATEKKSGMKYAVKIFRKRRSEDKATTAGLQQEIAVLMSVSHPNVLCLKGTYDEEDGVYLVLELAPEGELFNLIIQKQKLSEDEARKIFRQLLNGLKYLHERNIVHRDIKPENILLCDKDLTVKLADFGLAKIIGEESFTTSLCGTPSYVAPEILQNSSNRRYSRAVDIWSLGVVLYICLCGFPPFSDELCTRENPYNLADQIKQGIYDFPSPYWDSVGDPALDLIGCMLEIDPERRITVHDALKHPWIVNAPLPAVGDSCDSLAGAIDNLGFHRRKVVQERTLLAAAPDIVGNWHPHARAGGKENVAKDAKENGKKDAGKEAKVKITGPGQKDGEKLVAATTAAKTKTPSPAKKKPAASSSSSSRKAKAPASASTSPTQTRASKAAAKPPAKSPAKPKSPTKPASANAASPSKPSASPATAAGEGLEHNTKAFMNVGGAGGAETLYGDSYYDRAHPHPLEAAEGSVMIDGASAGAGAGAITRDPEVDPDMPVEGE